jgi:glycerol dehydrogenase
MEIKMRIFGSPFRYIQGALHGEMVAFGLLVQFMLEERSQQFLIEMLSFYKKIGLPTTLSELGIEPPTSEKLAPAIKAICEPTSTIENMPFEVKPEMVERAILKANHLGRHLNADTLGPTENNLTGIVH